MTDDSKSIRSIFWPIYGKEHIKFLPLALMMLCILFNYSMVRTIKDSFVVTGIGAEALGFLKTYFVFPSAIIITMLYYKLCNMMDSKKVFYVFFALFLAYFIAFGFYIFPEIESFFLTEQWVAEWTEFLPVFTWFFKIFEKWPYATFYIVSELWGSTMISLFFWQLANQVTNPNQAKRHYSMFGLLGNMGLVGTSYIIDYAVKREVPDYSIIFKFLIGSTIIIALLYFFVQNRVATDPELTDGVVTVKKKKKEKLSMGQSIKVVLSSKYLGLLAILLVSYGISNILIEAVWKKQVGVLYPDKAEYASFMASYQFYLGVISMFFMLVGSNILRLVSWTTAALITPVMFAVTALFFFLFIFGSQGGETALLSTYMTVSTAIFYAVMIGSVQNILSKATKYSLFDSTQKMAYMPLDSELKTKGMSAVEVIGGRFGKMGGGVITSTLLMIFHGSTLLDLTPALAIICAVIVVMWIAAVFVLGKEYSAALAAREQEAAEATA